MFRVSKDSSTIPHPVSGLAMPASVYMTVSRSGQMWSPQRSKSSAVFTTTVRSPGGSASCRPAASLAPPTPPASAQTFIVSPSGESAPLASKASSFIIGTFEGVAHDREEAEGVRDLSVERHGQGFSKRNAADAEALCPLGPPFAGHEPGGEKPHRVFVCDGVGEVSLSKHPPTSGFEAGLFLELALGGEQRFFTLRATAFRYLPRVVLEWITVLPDEIDVILLYRKDADGDVLVVHHAVDTRLAVRVDDSIL